MFLTTLDLHPTLQLGVVKVIEKLRNHRMKQKPNSKVAKVASKATINPFETHTKTVKAKKNKFQTVSSYNNV